MPRILITGGSGFIGTNLVEHFVIKGFDVYNADINEPRNKKHHNFWIKCDVCDEKNLSGVFKTVKPDYVVHLAAKTDLLGADLHDYDVNIKGVDNIVNNCVIGSGVKRAVFASTMLVMEAADPTSGQRKYSPTTLYGESKVLGEEVIYNNQNKLVDFCIIRPTSIWGEWFAEPYKDFFDLIISGRYFDLGTMACTKTYGYVGNAVCQIENLLMAEAADVQGKTFYIGDAPPLNISKWAIDIAAELGIKRPKEVPFLVFKLGAITGDILKKFGVKFPMSSFRLANMTTNNIIDLKDTYEICGEPPFLYRDAIKRTVNWMRATS